jgi:hypothetical protein
VQSTIRRFLLITALILLPAAVAADIGIPAVRELYRAHQGAEVSLMILPDGSGPLLTQAMTFQGGTVDATITAVIVDYLDCSAVVTNFPLEDMWLDAPGEDWRACSGANCWRFFSADVNTNVLGETVFQQGFCGGGWSLGRCDRSARSGGADPEQRRQQSGRKVIRKAGPFALNSASSVP